MTMIMTMIFFVDNQSISNFSTLYYENKFFRHCFVNDAFRQKRYVSKRAYVRESC